jgi:hypothetical protein
MSCKTCKYFDVPPDKDGKARIRKGNAYRCTAPMPECPPLPVCVSLEPWGFKWPPAKSWVTPDMGTDCPVYEQRN